MARTVREKAINLTGERRVDRKRGDVIRYFVLVDWLMIVATIVRESGWSTIQFFHESRRVVARFSHRRRVPATFVSYFCHSHAKFLFCSFLFYLKTKNIQSLKISDGSSVLFANVKLIAKTNAHGPYKGSWIIQ